jgi:hypothetical protein
LATSPPTQEAIGDWRDISVHAWGQRIVEVGLFSGGELKYRLDGDDAEDLIDLPFKGDKDNISVCVINDILHAVWSQYGNVRYARWSLVTKTVTLQPATIFAGTQPKVACFDVTKMIVLYVSATNTMESRNSLDTGDNWSTPNTIDPETDIENVAISVSSVDTSQFTWANAQIAPPLLFSESFQDQDWTELEVSAADFTSPDNTFTEDFQPSSGWSTTTDPVEPFDFSTPTASLFDDLSTW